MFSNYRLKTSLIAVLNTALADVGVTGFTVMSRSPQVMANRNRVILVDYLYSRRVGFQSAEQIVKPPTGSIKTAVEIPGKGWAFCFYTGALGRRGRLADVRLAKASGE